MLDWFGSGLFGGLFGPAIVQFLKRFKLSAIFIGASIGVQLIVFLVGVKIGGWRFAWHRTVETFFTPIGILVPLGIGALFALVMVICVPDLIGKSKDKK
jgi:hypothetical protein